MKTIISVLAVVAALGFAAAPAMAQQTVTANGTAVDGLGTGDNVANRYVFDGPANADVTSLTTAIGRLHSGGRVNRLDCDLIAAVNCNVRTGHSVANSILE